MQETQEIWVQSLGQEDPLEEEMTTHSSILAWKIPWTEEPGGYSPWGWRVRHNWVRMYSTTHSDLKQHFTVLETRSPKIKELAMWQSFWMLKQRIHSLAFPDSIDHIHSLAVATSSIFKAKSTESTNLSLSLSLTSLHPSSFFLWPFSIPLTRILVIILDPLGSVQSLNHVWIFVTPWTAAC